MTPTDPDLEIKPGNIIFFGTTENLWDITPYFILKSQRCFNEGHTIEFFHRKWILEVISPHDKIKQVRTIFYDDVYMII